MGLWKGCPLLCPFYWALVELGPSYSPVWPLGILPGLPSTCHHPQAAMLLF